MAREAGSRAGGVIQSAQAVHVMLRRCVNQKALSVYKGVVRTDYIDVHSTQDVDKIAKLMKEIKKC